MAKRKVKQENPGKVIIPAGHPNPPESHEIEAAQILAAHFRRTPIDDNILNSWLRDEMRSRKIKRVMCIRKDKTVVDIEV
jgi:hypothetical protein